MNSVLIVGWIGKTDLVYSKSGAPYIRTVISTKERVKDQSGQYQSVFEAHPVTIFGKTAEFVSKNFKKSDPVALRGKIQTQVHEGKWNTSIVAESIDFLPKPRGNHDSNFNDGSAQSYAGSSQSQGNRGGSYGEPSDQAESGHPLIDDLDLPF